MSAFRFKKSSSPEDLSAADAEAERSLADNLVEHPVHPAILDDAAKPTIPSAPYEASTDE